MLDSVLKWLWEVYMIALRRGEDGKHLWKKSQNVLKHNSKIIQVCFMICSMVVNWSHWRKVACLENLLFRLTFQLYLPQSFHGETEPASFSWTYEEIKEVHKRWWQLRDNAVEIFLTNGRTLLLAFDNTKVTWHQCIIIYQRILLCLHNVFMY